MSRVIWLDKACDDLEAVQNYYREHDAGESGQRIIAEIITMAGRLGEFPHLGRAGRVYDTRELIVLGGEYLVAYRRKNERLEILRVLHHARKWPL